MINNVIKNILKGGKYYLYEWHIFYYQPAKPFFCLIKRGNQIPSKKRNCNAYLFIMGVRWGPQSCSMILDYMRNVQ